MEQDRKPMVACSYINIEPDAEFANKYAVIKPGREQSPVFEGAEDEVIDCARSQLKLEGGGVIRVLNIHHEVAEEMRVSSEGEVVEQRTYDPSPQLLDESPQAEPDITIIELTAVDEQEIYHSMYLVLDHERNEVLAAISGIENLEGVRCAGFDVRKPAVNLRVTPGGIENCEREWGPISSAGIERKARDLCREQSMSLEGFAEDPRFGPMPEDHRELAAALWVLWERRLLSHEIRTPRGHAARISRYVLWIDLQGFVTFECFASPQAACGVMRKLAAQQYPQHVDSLSERVFDPSAPQAH